MNDQEDNYIGEKSKLQIKSIPSKVNEIDQCTKVTEKTKKEDLLGKFNFTFEMVNSNCSKQSGPFFSTELNKLFIKPEKKFIIIFRGNNVPTNCFIRAHPFFSKDKCSDNTCDVTAVSCYWHSHIEPFCSDENSKNAVIGTKHFIRSMETSTFYDTNHSITHPVVYNISNKCMQTAISYYFNCSSSCFNKFKIHLSFTLENNIEIFGRKTINLKVSSCPIRCIYSEQKHSQQTILSQKKNDDNDYESYSNGKLFWIPVRGEKNFIETNLFAEYLDIGRNEYLSKNKAKYDKVKKERDLLVNACQLIHESSNISNN